MMLPCAHSWVTSRRRFDALSVAFLAAALTVGRSAEPQVRDSAGSYEVDGGRSIRELATYSIPIEGGIPIVPESAFLRALARSTRTGTPGVPANRALDLSSYGNSPS